MKQGSSFKVAGEQALFGNRVRNPSRQVDEVEMRIGDDQSKAVFLTPITKPQQKLEDYRSPEYIRQTDPVSKFKARLQDSSSPFPNKALVIKSSEYSVPKSQLG